LTLFTAKHSEHDIRETLSGVITADLLSDNRLFDSSPSGCMTVIIYYIYIYKIYKSIFIFINITKNY